MFTNSKPDFSLLGRFREAFDSFIGIGCEKAENVLCAYQEIIVAMWLRALIASVRGAVNRQFDCEIRE